MTIGKILGAPRPLPSRSLDESSAVPSSSESASPDSGRSPEFPLSPPAAPSGVANLRKFFLSCMNCLPFEAASSAEDIPLLAIKRYVRFAYEDLRLFHGTNQSGLESIQSEGMSTRLKKQGATVGAFGTEGPKNKKFVQRARQHNFVAAEKEIAAEYANLTSNPIRGPRTSGADAVPKLARIFRTPDFPRIEKDLDHSARKHGVYRTRDDIPAHSVRQGKGANRYSEEILTALQKRMEHKFNVSLSLGEIEKTLLDGAESDSSEDFS